MAKFLLHWRMGEPTTVEGRNIADAVRKSGYGAGAMGALDYWERVEGKDKKDPHVKTFAIAWRDGKEERLQGSDIQDALTRAGYGGGAAAALDWHQEIKA